MSEQQPSPMFQAEVLEADLLVLSGGPREIALRTRISEGLTFALRKGVPGPAMALTVAPRDGADRGSIAFNRRDENEYVEGRIYLENKEFSAVWDAMLSGAGSAVSVGLSSDKLEVSPSGYAWDTEADRILPVAGIVFRFRRQLAV